MDRKAALSVSPMETGATEKADRRLRPVVLNALRDITLEPAEGLYRAVFDCAPDAVIVVAQDGRIIEANRQMTALFGYEREELLGQAVEVLLPERSQSRHVRHRAGFDERPTIRAMGQGLDLWGLRKDGSEFPVDVSLSPASEAGQTVTLAAIRDVTERHRAEEDLRLSEQRFRSIFENAPVGMAIVDREHRMREVNEALCRLLGFSAKELQKRRLTDVTPAEDVKRYAEALDRLFNGGSPSFPIEKRFMTSGGRALWTEVTFSLLGSAAGAEVVMVEDITARKLAEEHLTHLATHDQLTGLANRTVLTDRLRQAKARSARSGGLFAVLFVDLDDFKRVNDDYGHATGDAVLTEVARRVRTVVRPVDTVARHGGDEFVLCCEDLGPVAAEARAAVEAVARRLAAIATDPITTTAIDVTLTACVGIALCRGDAASPDALVAQADRAMYEAKQLGPGRIVVLDLTVS